MDDNPLALFGDKCSFNPISSIKLKSADNISFGDLLFKILSNIATIPLLIIASLSA